MQMSTSDTLPNPAREPLLPKGALRKAFANRDFVLTMAVLVKSSDKGDYLGQKLIDALIAHDIKPEEIERLIPVVAYWTGLTSMLGLNSDLDFKNAIRVFLNEFGGQLGTHEFVANMRKRENMSELLMQSNILNSLFGDWGEPGDIEEVDNHPGAYAAHPREAS